MALSLKNGMVDMTKETYIQTLLKTYSLVEVLSNKNDCKVLRLRHNALSKDLVLRSLPYSTGAYEKLNSLQCDNLPEIYDVKIFDDGQVVLEEFIEGMTVAQVMECGKYRRAGIKKVMKSLCNALAILHDQGLVHRDIKPENIMIGNNGRVVLIDFNAARQVGDKTKDTVIMGTVGYVSPEQLGLSQTDARTDLYAAGVLLNVLATGVHPSIRLARGHFGRIVRKCTAVNPKERYQSAEKLSEAI